MDAACEGGRSEGNALEAQSLVRDCPRCASRPALDASVLAGQIHKQYVCHSFEALSEKTPCYTPRHLGL